jgi:hypothetical protein
VKIKAYDHVGLRVLDRVRSLAFYKTLGLRLDDAHSSETPLEIVNEAGVRLNLILKRRADSARRERSGGSR